MNWILLIIITSGPIGPTVAPSTSTIGFQSKKLCEKAVAKVHVPYPFQATTSCIHIDESDK